MPFPAENQGMFLMICPATVEMPLKLTLFSFTKLYKHTWSSIFPTVFGIRRKRSHFPVGREFNNSWYIQEKKRGEMSDWDKEILQVFILMAEKTPT